MSHLIEEAKIDALFQTMIFSSSLKAFEDYKDYVDQELGKAPDTEKKFYQRLRDMAKVKDFNSKQEGRGFKSIRLKNEEEKECEATVQTLLEAEAVEAAAAGNLNSKEEVSGVEVGSGAVDLGVAAAAPVADPKVVRVLPSQGEPCQGATAAGGDCGYASEHYLVEPDGQKSAWCKGHLKRILSAYDPTNFSVDYGGGEGL